MLGTINGKNVLITGGCGFIGSNIAEALSGNFENRITVVDNLVSGKAENIKNLKDVHFMNADVRDPVAVMGALDGIDIVFHEAANIFVQKSIETPMYDAENNILGALNVLEGCRKNDVKRLVFASSCAIYGHPNNIPITENHQLNPISPYGASKRAAEEYCRIYYELYGLETVALRYFNVYGPRQDPSSPYSGVISVFVKNILAGKPLVVYGDGNQTRDFVNVMDVVSANILASESSGAVGKAMNIGTGKQVSLNDLIDAFRKITGKKIEVIYKDARLGDIKNSVSDITLAKKLLGFSPKVLLGDGLRELLG